MDVDFENNCMFCKKNETKTRCFFMDKKFYFNSFFNPLIQLILTMMLQLMMKYPMMEVVNHRATTMAAVLLIHLPSTNMNIIKIQSINIMIHEQINHHLIMTSISIQLNPLLPLQRRRRRQQQKSLHWI